MIESGLTTAKVNKREANLSDWYPSGRSDWEYEITEALEDVMQDVQDMGYNLRQVGKRLSLTSTTASTYTATTVTAAADGTKSSEDYINRRRLIVSTSSVTGTGSVVFTLQGTDDSSSETWTTIDTVTVTATGETTATFTNIYKFYRLNTTTLTGITSLTFTAYLIETTFELVHLYKTLEIIYRELIKISGEAQWTTKMEYYRDKYEERLSKLHIYYDETDDGEIGASEEEDDMREVTFGLGGNG